MTFNIGNRKQAEQHMSTTTTMPANHYATLSLTRSQTSMVVSQTVEHTLQTEVQKGGKPFIHT